MHLSQYMAGLIAVASLTSLTADRSAERSPSGRMLLLIAVDDLNPMLDATGSDRQVAPLDRLAADGLLFRRAYCQTRAVHCRPVPVCFPDTGRKRFRTRPAR